MTTSELQSIKQRFEIIGNSPLLNRDIEIAVQVAKTDLSVLVTGESGVGKEHFPKIIHAYSARKHGPYFAVNCGAIPEGTIDSELFGHEKGAFTDAKAERKGYFEIANGGTLFLDEVGELPIQTQVRLLRVLETGEFIRMGSSQVQKTNVRVVAATNLNMKKAIEEGRFREDLYYRLNTVEIRVPALRERKEDIPLLFRKFSVDFCSRYSMPSLSLTDEATELLQSYYWNGNIRQLKNIAEQVSVIEMDHHISAETLRHYLPDNERQSSLAVSAVSSGNGGKDYSHEIGILYNMILKLQQELNDLRAEVGGHASSAIYAAPPALMQGQSAPVVKHDEVQEAEVVKHNEVQEAEMFKRNNVQEAGVLNRNYVQEVEVIPQEQQIPRSLEDTQRELIRKTLEQCHHNRKATADKLGISERTLYRKIKEYDL